MQLFLNCTQIHVIAYYVALVLVSYAGESALGHLDYFFPPLVSLKVKIYSKAPELLDMSKQHMSISASLSRFRVTLVYLFVNRLLQFVEMVGVNTEEAKESARQRASAAVTAVSGLGSHSAR